MSTKRVLWLVAIPVVLVLTAVGLFVYFAPVGDDDDDNDDASWTFMAYVMGDTNLEPYALDDLAEMASVGSSDALNIVAMVDRSPDYSDDGLENLPDWEDTKLLEVQQDEFVELDDLGELNTGSGDTLATFVETTITEYPADHYALLLWDHGGGWIGMGPDESDDDLLALDEISEGIDTGLSAAGVDKLDMIGFDACLMATYEVVTTLAPYADYMVASEEVEPGHGWNYGQLAVVQETPEIATPDLAAAMLEGYSAQAEAEGTEADITLGILDLRGVDELAAAMDDVAGAFIDDPAAYSPELASAQHDVLEFGRDPDPEYSTYQIDLGGFLENLAESGEGELAEHAATASDALDAMVLDHVAGPATSASTGLSIYFPPLETYFEEASYLGLADVPTWPATLAEFFASGSLLDEGARATFHPTIDPTVTFTDDGVTVFAPMPEAGTDSVVEATVSVGYEEDDGEIVYLSQMPAAITDQDGTPGMLADYDLTYMTIGDGTVDSLVYQSISTDPETGYTVIDIPIDYVAPGDDEADEYEDGLISIVVDDDGAIVEEDFYVREDSGTMAAFEPDPDGLLFPIALASTTDDEWVYQRTGTEGIPADLHALEYSFEAVPAGVHLTFDLSVSDYSGASDYTTVVTDVP